MDTVRNVKINYPVKYYCLSPAAIENSLLAKAVRSIGQIFDIREIEAGSEMAMPFNSVWIHSIKLPDNETSPDLLLEISYWQDNNLAKFSVPLIGAATATNINRKVYLLYKTITGQNPNPWGVLRGVRPTKIVHKLLAQGLSMANITTRLMEDYLLSSEKAKLAVEVVSNQMSVLEFSKQQQEISIYIGIPFCPSRCLYCSFISSIIPANNDELILFMTAIEQDIDAVVELMNNYNLQVMSVYIGGGTPTSLPDEFFACLIKKVRNNLIQPNTKEFTVEAGRPDSFNDFKIRIMSEFGVSRISINPQTMQQKTLQSIGRNHTVEQIYNVYAKIRSKKTMVINMDVIAGLPGESVSDMINTMSKIAELQPDNLTVHTLAIKRGSALHQKLDEFVFPVLDDVRRMMSIADSYAREMGMYPYYLYRQKNMLGNLENIGYANQGSACLYNILMIEEKQTIIGIGPGATTKAVDVNTDHLTNLYFPKNVKSYIDSLHIYTAKRQQLLERLFV